MEQVWFTWTVANLACIPKSYLQLFVELAIGRVKQLVEPSTDTEAFAGGFDLNQLSPCKAIPI